MPASLCRPLLLSLLCRALPAHEIAQCVAFAGDTRLYIHSLNEDASADDDVALELTADISCATDPDITLRLSELERGTIGPDGKVVVVHRGEVLEFSFFKLTPVDFLKIEPCSR